MIKKIILILMFLMSLGFVTATLNDNVDAYYRWDSSLTSDETGNFTLTNVGSVALSSDAIIGNSSDYNGARHLTQSASATNSFSTGSINLWVKLDNEAASYNILAKNSANFRVIYSNTLDDIGFQVNGEGVSYTDLNETWTNYHMVTFVWHGSQKYIYVDGILQLNVSGAANTPASGDLFFGHNSVNTNDRLQGNLDEYGFWSKKLTQQEITDLYNSGAGIQYPFDVGTEITFNNPQQGDILNNTSFTLNVSFSQITNSTYILNNGTETTLGTNQNESTVNLTGIEGLNSITVFTNTSGQLSNSSITFTIDTNAPELNVSLPAEYNFYDIDFTQYISFNDTNNVTCIVFIQQTGNITNCLNDNYTFNLAGNLTLDIIAEDSAGNVNSSLNNSIFVNPFAYFQVQLSNATALTNFTIGGRSDVNGTVTYTTFNDGLVIGENTLEFEKPGYITQDITFNLTDTPPAFNQTYNVSEAEINVFIRDRETNQIITGTNFTLEFIANVGLITSTTTGTATITNVLFQEEEYQLVVTNDANYTTESVFFTFTNKESLDVTVHVQDSTLDNYGVVDVKVVDKFGKAIQGAIVQALQWDTNTSSFIRVSEGLTAEDGKSLLNVILDTKLYIFNAQFGDLTANTSQQFIPTLLNGKEIVIPLDTGPTTETGLFENVLFTITENFDNNTYVSNISFSWNNRDGTDITGCIKYFRVQTSGTRTLLSEDCSTGSVVTDLSVSKMLNSSYYIFAEVGFDQGASGFYVLQTYKYTPLFDVSNILKQTNLALYILPLLYLLAVFIGMLNPFVGGIGLIVVNIFALILTPQYVNGVTMGFMYFIGGLIMYAGGKKR